MENCNMEALKFSKIEKKTSEYYKEIIGVSYIPAKVHYCIIKRKKGETHYWRLWGLIPLFRVKNKRTILWTKYFGTFYEDEFENRTEYHLHNDALMRRPFVEIQKVNKQKDIIYYNTDEEAHNAFEEICQTCKTLGIKLF